MKFLIRSLVLLIAVAIIAGGIGISQFSLSALPEPGRLETFLADRMKRLLIHRTGRAQVPPPPADLQSSIEEGDKLFGSECATCHGLDGHTPTDAGRWMYPRAANLASREVQNYSDREIFWIVKNGIRLSGMPAFGKVEPDEHIWNLVQYLRTIPAAHN